MTINPHIPLTVSAQSNCSLAYTAPPNQGYFIVDRLEVRIEIKDDWYFWKMTDFFDDTFENCGGYIV